jgi:pantoate--beta-alanine ligase
VNGLRVVRTIAELREHHDRARREGGTVGLVPTMGYLHAGHLSLIEAARRDCDLVTTTLFVNPLQFAANEDLSSYPRDFDRDRQLAADAGADLLFAPEVGEMYPDGRPLTQVSVAELAGRWEGASRPTHFAGVATVVAKLFAIAGPCRAYFGEKDYQQLHVVGRMVRDLDFPVDVVGCPIVREPDGLALSSRNVYLSAQERQAATCLRRALDVGQAAVAAGGRRSAAVDAAMGDVVRSEPLATLDYAAVVDAATLEPAPDLLQPGRYRLIVAAKVGTPRLIDNDDVVVPG